MMTNRVRGELVELGRRELTAHEVARVSGAGDPPPPERPPTGLGPHKPWVPKVAPTQDYGDANRGFYDYTYFMGGHWA
jgi:hypothetical protein